MTDILLDLTEKDIEVLRAGEPKLSPTDDVRFGVCAGCARPEFIWRRPGTGKTEAAVGARCDACEKFRFRHPEVFAYIVQFHQAAKFIESRMPKDKKDE